MGDSRSTDEARDPATDLAARLRAAQAAQARQRDRMTTLNAITAQLLAATELEAVLQAVVESASRLCDASGAMAALIEPGGADGPPLLRPRAVHGALAGLFRLVEGGERLTPAYFSNTAMGRAIDQGEVVVVEDYATWPASPERRERALAMGARSFAIAPLRVGGASIGVLLVGDAAPRAYAPEDVALVQALADQVALAVEQARLHERERQSTRELATLLEISRALTTTLELEPLLDAVLDHLKLVADYTGASVTLLEDGVLRQIVRRAPTPDTDVTRGPGVAPDPRHPILGPILRGEAVIIDDVRDDSPLARAYRQAVGVPLECSPLHYVRSWLSAPLATPGRVVGMVSLGQSDPGFYTPRHAALAIAIATQAAVAIENARLYGEARKLAALEERQRLARELHDSVSQVLFSIGLGARTAGTLLERGDAARAAPSVQYIARLAEMGTAEMRALLFELRPEALEEEGLVAALAKHAAALEARHNLTVALDLGAEPAVPLDAKEALYRIAQEATHNTVKHARAATVTLALRRDGDGLVLEVADDGVGFDATGSFPGHLGLVSMRERAERLGGTLTIESAPGRGTEHRVRIPIVV